MNYKKIRDYFYKKRNHTYSPEFIMYLFGLLIIIIASFF